MQTVRRHAPAASLFGAPASIAPDLLERMCRMDAGERALAEAAASRVRAEYGVQFCASIH